MRDQAERFLRSLRVGELLEAREIIEELLRAAEESPEAAPAAQGPATERRRFSRHTLSLPVTYFRHRAAGSAHRSAAGVRHAVVRDISRGGIRLVATEPLVPDEVLTVYLPGPLGVRKLFVSVTHVQKRGARYECGAAFVGFDRVYSAHRTEVKREESAQVLVACEPSKDRNALADLLAKQGYVPIVANSVPEACETLEGSACPLIVAGPSMLLAEEGRLLDELEARGDGVLSILFISACDVDLPENERVAHCDDLLSAPPWGEEVRSILRRASERLTARRARGGGSALA